MQVKLHALFGSLVNDLDLLRGTDSACVYNKLACVFIVLDVAHYGDGVALADSVDRR